VRLGHPSQQALKKMVLAKSVLGLGVLWDDIKDLELGLCNACMKSRMHAFPIPASISKKTYEVFEYITCDYCPFSIDSIRGYKGIYIYGDRKSEMIVGYLVKSKTEWLETFQLLINDYGPGMNENSHRVRIFMTDFASEVHEHEFSEYLAENQIKLYNSAPYKHHQNLIERYIQTLKNMLRTVMSYNNAPPSYWCYAIIYTIDTYNMLMKSNDNRTRLEIFTGDKVDVSKTVPFYSTGWAHIDEKERKAKHTTDRSWRVKMLGYSEPYEQEDYSNTRVFIKNSYLVKDLDNNRELIRHDVVFQNYPDNLNLLSLSESEREENESSPDSTEEQFDYTNLVKNSITDYEESEVKLNLPEEELDDILEETEYPKDEPSFLSQPPRIISDDEDSNESDSTTANDTMTKLDFSKLIAKMQSPLTRTPSTRKRTKKVIKSMMTQIMKWKTFQTVPKKTVRFEDKIEYLPSYKVTLDEVPLGLMASVNLAKSKLMSNLEELRSKRPLVINVELDNQITTLPIDLDNVKPPPVKYLPTMDLDAMTPKNCVEALQGEFAEHWYHAIRDELENLSIRKTWKLINTVVNRAVDLHAIKSKYAFRVTVKPDGTLKLRARLVACGYSQVPGLDFDETYAPTAKYKSLCIILFLCAILGWFMSGGDVTNAYVEACIDKLIFMMLPKELFRDSNGQPIIVELLKSLYGLKQAGELWNRLLNGKFCDLGFTRLAHDRCVYIKRNVITSAVTIIVVYVDDILFTGNDQKVIDETLDYLAEQFTKITDITVLTKYIGVEIERDFDNHTIYVSQKLYTQQYVDANVPVTSTPKLIPLSESIDYVTKGDLSIEPIHDHVGKLRYLADRVRPDLLTSVGILGSAATNPTVNHLQGVTTLGRYLKGTISARMAFGGMNKEVKLFGYCDASHLPANDSKPRLGYCFFLNNESGTILARSFKGKSVSHSSCESEIYAIDETVRQAIWLRGFLAELGFPQLEPTVIYTDSQSAKTLIDSFNVGNNSAHLTMRINYLHEQVEQGTIVLKYIDTLHQVADILTKLLPVHAHEFFTETLSYGHHGLDPSPKAKIKYKTKPKSKFKQDMNNKRTFILSKPTSASQQSPPTGTEK
jgi:hypothetical protein